MKEDEKFVIHLSIANMEFPLTIYRKDEELCRKAAEEVNKKVNSYKDRYAKANLSQEQYIAMVAYDFAKMVLQADGRISMAPYTERLSKLTDDIKSFLKDE